MAHLFADPLVLSLVQAILAVLGLGSLSGWLLKRWVAKGRPHGVIDNMVVRVKAWWLIAGVLGLAFLAGRTGVCLLFAFASFLALGEYLPKRATPTWERGLAWGGYLMVLPLQYWLVWSGRAEWLPVLVPAYAFLLVPVAVLVLGCPRPAALQWGLMFCVLGVSFAPALLALNPPGGEGRGGFLLMFLLLVTQLGDVFQYIWGKLAGRHALAPRISPSKTVEGLVGGVLSATLLGGSLAGLTPFSTFQAALVALGISLLGVLGGLLLSAEKRRRGIKDWGTLIGGHGGMLDRLDSLCLSAPAFYGLMNGV